MVLTRTILCLMNIVLTNALVSRKISFLNLNIHFLCLIENKTVSLPTIDDDTPGHSLIGVVEKIDCKMSPWKHEPCNATCGEGVRVSHRSILVSFKDNYLLYEHSF